MLTAVVWVLAKGLKHYMARSKDSADNTRGYNAYMQNMQSAPLLSTRHLSKALYLFSHSDRLRLEHCNCFLHSNQMAGVRDQAEQQRVQAGLS